MTESNTAAANRIYAELIERWPALFDPEKPVPLAIGMREALVEAIPNSTDYLVNRVLFNWCSRPRYLNTLTAGADRHGFEGVQGAVTEEEAAEALESVKVKVAAIKAKARAKRKAQKAALAAIKAKAKRIKEREEAEAQKAIEAAAAKAKQEAEQKAKAAQKRAAQPPAKPTGPTVIVKKRRFAPPGLNGKS